MRRNSQLLILSYQKNFEHQIRHLHLKIILAPGRTRIWMNQIQMYRELKKGGGGGGCGHTFHIPSLIFRFFHEIVSANSIKYICKSESNLTTNFKIREYRRSHQEKVFKKSTLGVRHVLRFFHNKFTLLKQYTQNI